MVSITQMRAEFRRFWTDIWIRYPMRKEDEFGSAEEVQRTMMHNNKDKDPPGEDHTISSPLTKKIPPPYK